MAVVKTFTPELIANGRHRYEFTDEPVASIAADFGVAERTMNKYVHKWGWSPRSERPPHDLSLLARLREEAKHIPAPPPAPAAVDAQAPCDHAIAQSGDESQSVPPGTSGAAPDAFAAERTAVIERMWRAVDAELAAVEQLRAQLGAQPQQPAEAEKTARALESIMRTFKEVDRLRFSDARSAAADNDDDLPRDLDEFRRELARRIEAFVRSRADDGMSGDAASEGVDLAR